MSISIANELQQKIAQKTKKKSNSTILYSRDEDLNQLKVIYDRVLRGGCEIVFISGEAGIGKTSLINAFQESISEDKGWFLHGKYDLVDNNLTYSGFKQALECLAHMLLKENRKKITFWRERINYILGYNVNIITSLAPEFEKILGKQKKIFNFDPVSEHNRFIFTLRKFFTLFSQVEHPLIFFLDDLHWADQSSTEMLTELLTEFYGHFLFIGTYRNKEMSHNVSCFNLIESITQCDNLQVNQIELSGLSFRAIQKLINDKLNIPIEDNASLSEYFMIRSGGNPFFINLLTQEVFHTIKISGDIKNTLSHYLEDGLDKQHFERILMRKLRRLPAQSREVVEYASCLGNCFSAKNLSIVFNKNITTIIKMLEPTINENLLKKGGDDIYHFIHDKIQDTIYNSLSKSKWHLCHYVIGFNYLEAINHGNSNISLADAIDHINKGKKYVIDKKMKYQISYHNLFLANEMKQNLANESAKSYAEHGLEYLDPSELWSPEMLNLTIQFLTIQLQIHFSMGEENLAEIILNTILKNVNDNKILINLYITVIEHYTAYGNYQQAIKSGKTALKLLEFDIENIDKDSEEGHFETCKDIIRQICNLQLKKKLLLTLESDIISQILNKMFPAAFIENKELYRTITYILVQRAYQIGFSVDSAFCIANFGTILIDHNDYQLAYTCGTVSKMLLDKHRHTDQIKIQFLVFCVLSPWVCDLNSTTIKIVQIKEESIRRGEFLYAGYIMHMLALLNHYRGIPIKQLLQDIKRYTLFVNKIGSIVSISILNALNALLSLYLTVNTSLIDQLDNDQETNFLINLVQIKQYYGYAIYCIYKIQFYFIHGKTLWGYSLLKKVEKHIHLLTCFLAHSDFYYYKALILIDYIESHYLKNNEAIFNEIVYCSEVLKNLKHSNSNNFSHKYHLVMAKLSKLQSNVSQSLHHFDKALDFLSKNHFVHDLAITNEQLAKFFISIDNKQLARQYIQKAITEYNAWGATLKVILLSEQYSDYLDTQRNNPIKETQSFPNIDDYWSATKISHDISNEDNLKKYVSKISALLLKTTNSRKISLITSEKNNLLIEFEMDMFNTASSSKTPIPFSEWRNGPHAVVQYVKLSHTVVVINSKQFDPRFESDSYISRKQYSQILCLPIVSSNKIIGILYLENNLSENIFTSSSIRFVELLASQIFNAIESVRLYREMQNEIIERKQAEKELFIRERYWHSLISICPVAIFRTNARGDCLFVNEQACKLFGMNAADEQFKNWADSIHPTDKPMVVALWNQAIREHKPFQAEYRIRRIDTKIVWVFGQAVEEMTPGTVERTFIGTYTDITALRNAQKKAHIRKQQLDRVERLNTMGEVATSLAHQLNQPLTVITTLSDICANIAEKHEDHQMQTSLKKIASQAHHAGEIIHRIKNLFHSGELHITPTDINKLIEQTLRVLAENSGHITIKTFLDKNLPLLMIDSIQIEQVLINIINNAIEAMETSLINYPTIKVTSEQYLNHVIISIKDNGPGIDNEIIDEIFEPFFTTKQEGMGMGLAICKTIVEAHCGSLECSNEINNHGTIFTLRLPIKEI